MGIYNSQSASGGGLVFVTGDSTTNSSNAALMTLETSGNLTISNGNLIVGTAGKGIDFSATSSGTGTMTSELLADYEEGTWTPTATTSIGTITAFTAEATYVKVGSVVTVRAAVKITTPGTASGVLIITGYPFTSYNYTDNSRASTFLVREDALTGIAYQGFISDNSTGGEIATMTNGSVVWTANSTYIFQATYHTAF